MDTRVLKYFLVIAQEESITKAAEILHTTQPNLSRQLHELEDRIGKQLLVRGNKKTTLTEEGMFLRKRAQEIIELIEKTESDLETYGEDISGSIHIGAAETHAMKDISKHMLALRKDYPKIQFHIFSGSTIEVTEKIHKGLIDFGILVAPVDLSKYDYLKLPIKDSFGILMRKDSPLAKLSEISCQDIIDLPLIVSQQQLDGNVLSGWLKRDIKSLDIVSTFNLITTPAMMVEAGLGYAFTFDKLVNTNGDSELCYRPLFPKIETELYFVWKKHQMFSPAAKLFLDYLQLHFFK